MRSQSCHIVMSQIHEMTTSPGYSVVTDWCSPCEVIMMSLWYQNYDITCVTCLWGHCDMSLPHHHEVKVLSQCDVTDVRDDHIIMRPQCCHRTMLTMWDLYDIKIMTSLLWDFCEVTVRQVEQITIMSQCCHNMMSQIHKMTTSLWCHSVVTVWCHTHMRWPHHHEVTVLSQNDAHHVRSLWYQNYDMANVRFVWGHRDTSWAQQLEVTVLSQYYVTGTQGDHITMRSQCCHMTMLTLRGHYDVLMI